MKDKTKLKQQLEEYFSPNVAKTLLSVINQLIEEEIARRDAISKEEEIDIKEVARMTGLTTGTLYIYKGRNQIPSQKRGKKLFFLRSEIEAWNAERLGDSLGDRAKDFEEAMVRQGERLLG